MQIFKKIEAKRFLHLRNPELTTQQYVKNLKTSLEILVRRIFSSQEKLSFSKLVLKSPQIKAFKKREEKRSKTFYFNKL